MLNVWNLNKSCRLVWKLKFLFLFLFVIHLLIVCHKTKRAIKNNTTKRPTICTFLSFCRTSTQTLRRVVVHDRKPFPRVASVDRNFGDSGSELHPYVRFAYIIVLYIESVVRRCATVCDAKKEKADCWTFRSIC